jgi:hypothetical protein
MSETERVKMQAELTELIEKWLDKQCDNCLINCCSELSRMMAVAALAVAEASTTAYSEGQSEN